MRLYQLFPQRDPSQALGVEAENDEQAISRALDYLQSVEVEDAKHTLAYEDYEDDNPLCQGEHGSYTLKRVQNFTVHKDAGYVEATG